MLKAYKPIQGLHIRSNIQRACEQAKAEGTTLSYFAMGIWLEIQPTSDASQEWEAFLLKTKKQQQTARRDRMEHAQQGLNILLTQLKHIPHADLKWLIQYASLQPHYPKEASTPEVVEKLTQWSMSYDPNTHTSPFDHAHWMALYMLPFVQTKRSIPRGWNTPFTEHMLNVYQQHVQGSYGNDPSP